MLCTVVWMGTTQEAAEKLEAARKQGTGWVKVDKDLVARVQSARQKVDAALQKAVRLIFALSALVYIEGIGPC